MIAINDRGFCKSSMPNDKDYGKKVSVGRVFSRLKEVFGLVKNWFVGMKKVAMYICACAIAYVVKYGRINCIYGIITKQKDTPMMRI
ncbi:MAG: hypothetical protein QXN16_01570 [Candidatus Micrarchaeaceae archaeon]